MRDERKRKRNGVDNSLTAMESHHWGGVSNSAIRNTAGLSSAAVSKNVARVCQFKKPLKMLYMHVTGENDPLRCFF